MRLKDSVSTTEDLMIVWKELGPLKYKGKLLFNSIQEKMQLKLLHLKSAKRSLEPVGR